MQGRLPWPVKGGKVTAGFGRILTAGARASAGVTLEAPAGSSVYAVYPGQVIYADWLAGLGLLIIVKHSEDYLTLYAHNESLYKTRAIPSAPAR